MRLPSVDSDIVIHLNLPLSLAPASSSAAVAETGGGGGEVVEEGGERIFRKMLTSLQIKDWGLFESPCDEGGGGGEA